MMGVLAKWRTTYDINLGQVDGIAIIAGQTFGTVVRKADSDNRFPRNRDSRPGFADAGSMQGMTDASWARAGAPARLMLTDRHAPKYGRALPRTGPDTQHHNAGRPVLQGFADSIG